MMSRGRAGTRTFSPQGPTQGRQPTTQGRPCSSGKVPTWPGSNEGNRGVIRPLAGRALWFIARRWEDGEDSFRGFLGGGWMKRMGSPPLPPRSCPVEPDRRWAVNGQAGPGGVKPSRGAFTAPWRFVFRVFRVFRGEMLFCLPRFHSTNSTATGEGITPALCPSSSSRRTASRPRGP
jgi:hypothetical protein